jgi:nicotinate phosphoribosyltransferase
VSAVRLDSGDLLRLSKETRRLLDEAGLQRVGIFVSGNLDEDAIAGFIRAGAPIDGFGVGTEMGVPPDPPTLDFAYKLVSYEGRGRIKLSPEKSVLPGRKQVFRVERDEVAASDVVARHDERAAGRPLLRHVMEKGIRASDAHVTLDNARRLRDTELRRLPDRLRALAPADPPYAVGISPLLTQEAERLREQYATRRSEPLRRP